MSRTQPITENSQSNRTRAGAAGSVVRWLLLAGVVIFSTACAVRLAYNYLDRLMLWQIERYVSLEGEQKPAAREALRRFHDWHRQTQLMEYSQYLHALQQGVDKGPVTSQFIHAETDKIQELMDYSLERMLPDVARIASSFSDAQVEQLENKLEERRQKFIREYVNLSPAKQADKRYKKMKGYLDDWLGGLSRQQREWLKEWSESLEPYEALTAIQQMHKRHQLIAALQERKDADALLAKLRNVAPHRSGDMPKQAKALVDRNQERTYTLLAKILNDRSDRQDERFKRKIGSYIRDFESLAPDVAATPAEPSAP